MQVHLLLQHPLGDPRAPVVDALAREMKARGWGVKWTAEADSFIDLGSLAVDSEIYLFKTSSEILLSLAGILHDRGARLVNTYAAASYVRDKPRVTAAMIAAGLPAPKSCFAGDAVSAFVKMGGRPIIIKPPRGREGVGIEISHDALDAARINGGPHFVQSYQRTNPNDLKVYVIGQEVCLLHRRFPAETMEDKRGRLGRCPEEIFGVDFVETAGGEVIVDVNSFPAMIGVPNAAGKITDYLESRL